MSSRWNKLRRALSQQPNQPPPPPAPTSSSASNLVVVPPGTPTPSNVGPSPVSSTSVPLVSAPSPLPANAGVVVGGGSSPAPQQTCSSGQSSPPSAQATPSTASTASTAPVGGPGGISPPETSTASVGPVSAMKSLPSTGPPTSISPSLGIRPSHSPFQDSTEKRPLQRSVSVPVGSPRIDPATGNPTGGSNRPPFNRSKSRTEVVKNYIRRETAFFFGVEASREEEQRARWMERRKRFSERKYGPLKPDAQSSTSAYNTPQPREGASSQPDVLPSVSCYGGGAAEAMGGHPLASTSSSGPRGSVGSMAVTKWTEPPPRRKQSVAGMTFSGLAYVVATLTRHRPRPESERHKYSRSYQINAIPIDENDEDTEIEEEEVFFESPLQRVRGDSVLISEQPASTTMSPPQPTMSMPPVRLQASRMSPPVNDQRSWQRVTQRKNTQREPSEAEPEVGCSRIWNAVLDRVLDNSNRRQYGMGVVGRFFGRSVKEDVHSEQQKNIDDMEDHRPFFTCWITTVQVLVLIISLACYGFGPIGLDLHQRSGQVLVTSLSLQQVVYMEPANFWIGPRAADLIHLGAKFAPCMRRDAKIMKEIEKGREKERDTACCIRNDDSGCVQSSKNDCSNTISTWKKWSLGDSGPGGRISGSVCGLDPKFCEAPASIAPYEWPDDITKWPICRRTNIHSGMAPGQNGGNPTRASFRKDKIAEHMACEVIGHPCCIGIHGQCHITTKEYCDFVRGYFHEEASLCSQVSCLDDVCGMIPFYFPEIPDQFYRLWMSLFLHAGIIHIFITLVIQYFLMRDLEKLTGSMRICFIYLGSGIAGNLASAIFVPYRAEVGPAGSQFGLFACQIVEVLHIWPILEYPRRALVKLISITFVYFLFGLLPWVDNYAHLFGFIFGFLLSYAFMPFVGFGPYDRQKKIALVWVCLLSAAFLFVALLLLFYVIPVYDCQVCSYFNCLPLTQDFCASQNINFKRQDPINNVV